MVTGDMVTGARAPAAADARAAEARAVAETVTDPELPMLTLHELGVLRDVRVDPAGRVEVTITPTYTGCPAVQTMRDDLRARLAEAGFARVEIRTVLHPPWTTDWISESGRRKLADAGIAPPGPAPRRTSGPIPLTLGPSRTVVRCPRCGSPDTDELSRFGPTACKALRRCRACREPFEHFKEI
ncbi:1,2-phenylacetyl-CoA epoxidase subunit PaaD [Actinomadura sp. NPDC047616]|uniref:1,2-phenylacetyl-CoA epoxidase subunit PaaD n=1 Tax=Actinomadura sp. NPDC047616 TaxID=3155914 RepID=UPI003404FC69